MKSIIVQALFCLASVAGFAAEPPLRGGLASNDAPLSYQWFSGGALSDRTNVALIPAPQKMTIGNGRFSVRPDTRICVDAPSLATGQQLAERWRRSTGFPLNVETVTAAGGPIDRAVLLTTQNAKSDLGAEGYELTVSTNAVVIRAPAQAGLFYGEQTLSQLLPPEIFSTNAVTNKGWNIPSVQIEDRPRFQWRGMLLDVSRDFFTVEEVERLLDLLAMHKINRFHWHLVDNDGWRIEIKKYPKLTEVGAWREHSRVLPRRQSAGNFEQGTAHPAWALALPSAYGPDGRYGGFYTQEQIRAVVAYAQTLHITIVPEIEMPGHSAAALAAYPQFLCDGASHGNVYCAGEDATFDFLQDVLTEVFELFPGPYIHIGGDEVRTDNWSHCDRCQARMKSEGLTNVNELQSYFIKRIEKFVNTKDRRLIGWSEIMKGGLAQNATVMDWIGGAVEAASAGHDVIMSPESDCYLDHYQSRDHSTEPWAIGGYLPLRNAYLFDPIPPKLEPDLQSHILGAQGNLWTEYVASFKHVEYMAFPRMCALAEVCWSPKKARDWDDFSHRLASHLQRLDQLGVNYRPLSPEAVEPDKK